MTDDRSRNDTKCLTFPQNACPTGGPEDWNSAGRAWRPISRCAQDTWLSLPSGTRGDPDEDEGVWGPQLEIVIHHP